MAAKKENKEVASQPAATAEETASSVLKHIKDGNFNAAFLLLKDYPESHHKVIPHLSTTPEALYLMLKEIPEKAHLEHWHALLMMLFRERELAAQTDVTPTAYRVLLEHILPDARRIANALLERGDTLAPMFADQVLQWYEPLYSKKEEKKGVPAGESPSQPDDVALSEPEQTLQQLLGVAYSLHEKQIGEAMAQGGVFHKFFKNYGSEDGQQVLQAIKNVLRIMMPAPPMTPRHLDAYQELFRMFFKQYGHDERSICNIIRALVYPDGTRIFDSIVDSRFLNFAAEMSPGLLQYIGQLNLGSRKENPVLSVNALLYALDARPGQMLCIYHLQQGRGRTGFPTFAEREATRAASSPSLLDEVARRYYRDPMVARTRFLLLTTAQVEAREAKTQHLPAETKKCALRLAAELFAKSISTHDMVTPLLQAGVRLQYGLNSKTDALPYLLGHPRLFELVLRAQPREFFADESNPLNNHYKYQWSQDISSYIAIYTRIQVEKLLEKADAKAPLPASLPAKPSSSPSPALPLPAIAEPAAVVAESTVGSMISGQISDMLGLADEDLDLDLTHPPHLVSTLSSSSSPTSSNSSLVATAFSSSSSLLSSSSPPPAPGSASSSLFSAASSSSNRGPASEASISLGVPSSSSSSAVASDAASGADLASSSVAEVIKNGEVALSS